MPRWPKELTDSIIYLYPSKDDAKNGTDLGGSGFLVWFGWEDGPKKERAHIYAVTNYHVAVSGGASFIRLNTKDGKTAVYETGPEEWFWHDGHDVAVHRMQWDRVDGGDSILDYKSFEFTAMALDDDIIRRFNLGQGDEVVSAGRFVDLSGRQSNEPMVRSGIVSLMGPVPVKTNKTIPWRDEPCHIIEMRSRTGFSGSPVYIYIQPLSPRMVDTEVEVDLRTFYGPWLLGVQSGQYPVREEDADEASYGTSMATVVPCAVLIDLLLRDEHVIEDRNEDERRHKTRPEAVSELSEPSTKADNPSHKEDFSRLLDAAAKTPKSSD